MNPTDGAGPRRLARMAGALYLVNIVGGAFAIGVVPLLLFGPDPAITAQNIQSHELLYRAGLTAHVLVVLTNIPLAVLFFELFKIVNRRLAFIDVGFILVATAVEASGLVNQFQPLILLGNGSYAGRIPAEQLQTLAYLPWQMSEADYTVHTVFFGFDILLMAYLVIRSTFLPKTIGVLLAIDAFAYLLYSFANLLAPEFAAQLAPAIQLPALIGEGALCVWLLTVGVNIDRWNRTANQAIPFQTKRAEVLG